MGLAVGAGVEITVADGAALVTADAGCEGVEAVAACSGAGAAAPPQAARTSARRARGRRTTTVYRGRGLSVRRRRIRPDDDLSVVHVNETVSVSRHLVEDLRDVVVADSDGIDER